MNKETPRHGYQPKGGLNRSDPPSGSDSKENSVSIVGDERFHSIDVRAKGSTLHGGEILLDGKLVKGVTAIEIKASIHGVTIVTLTMIANINCDLRDVKIDE
jgi:hypothetical protein